MDFYLVGTNHSNQLLLDCTDGNDMCLEFKNYLSNLCDTESIDLLAEELSTEALGKWKAKGSVVEQLATERQITHIFCDPNSDQRRELGIPNYEELKSKLGYGRFLKPGQQTQVEVEERSYWPIREEFWLNRVFAITANKCLFVLGSSHVDSFSMLLSNRGFSIEIKNLNWPMS
jgi:hypothetical protein